ncbi:MAG: hypothetical protein ACEQSL_05080 [Sediminibacterium sp.]
MIDIDGTGNDKDNMGGIAFAYFVPVTGLDELPPLRDGSYYTPILLNAGYSWLSIKHKFEEAKYNNESKETVHGTLFPFVADFFIPYAHFSKTENFREMVKHRFLLVTADYNRNSKLSGAPDNTLNYGLHFKFKENVLSKISGDNGYLITFYGEFDRPAVGYDYTVITAGGGGGQ